MAVIKRISGKSSTKKILNYVMSKEKTEEKIITGIDCNPETAHEEMTLTKQMHDKTEGVKYHHVIQSFKPGEIEADKAHEIGVELAEKHFKGFECIVATHIDKDHIHNHIVLNSVSRDTGNKYRASNKSLWDIKRESNKICEREKLSVIDLDKKAQERISTPELRLRLSGKESFMHDLKQVIDHCRNKVSSLGQLGNMLKEKFNVQMKVRGNTISYKHPEKDKYTRGSKLGESYTKEGLERGFTRQSERRDYKSEIIFRRNTEITGSRSDSIDRQNQNLGERSNQVESEDRPRTQDSIDRAEHSNREEQQTVSRIDTSIEGLSRSKQSEVRNNYTNGIPGAEEERREIEIPDKRSFGIGEGSQEHTKPILERKGEAIRGSTSDNNRPNIGNHGGLSAINALDTVLQALRPSIDKAEQAEKETLDKKIEQARAKVRESPVKERKSKNREEEQHR